MFALLACPPQLLLLLLPLLPLICALHEMTKRVVGRGGGVMPAWWW